MSNGVAQSHPEPESAPLVKEAPIPVMNVNGNGLSPQSVSALDVHARLEVRIFRAMLGNVVALNLMNR